jgi:5-(carboxyamino)imidazole ribonucleotide synthase
MNKLIGPGAAIGVIGGGQLGRMLLEEARRMGYRTAILDADLTGPAAQAADHVFAPKRWEEFTSLCQVATYEFEHLDFSLVERVAARITLRPKAEILAIKRNRITEKTYLRDRGFPVPRFEVFPELAQVTPDPIPLPLVIKTATGGYDGKGLYLIHNHEELKAAQEESSGPVIVEELVNYVKEFSVMCARDAWGNIAVYPPGENVHDRGILLHTTAPLDLLPKEMALAREIAASLAKTLDLVGIVGIEMFLLPSGEILINEFAPRPHNSGHYTQDGCNLSQFETLLRVMCGLPLEEPRLLTPTAMLNILGHNPVNLPWSDILAPGEVKLHLYGKAEARPRRKMGHLNILAPSITEVQRKLALLKGILYPQKED